MVFADMVFHTAWRKSVMRLPSAGCLHAVVGVADGRFVSDAGGVQLQRFVDLIRTAEADFVERRQLGVMVVRSDLPLTTVFSFSNQFRLIEAAVARPVTSPNRSVFIGHFVHTVYGQRLRRNDFNAGFSFAV